MRLSFEFTGIENIELRKKFGKIKNDAYIHFPSRKTRLSRQLISPKNEILNSNSIQQQFHEGFEYFNLTYKYRGRGKMYLLNYIQYLSFEGLDPVLLLYATISYRNV